jgi:hypothetical protein
VFPLLKSGEREMETEWTEEEQVKRESRRSRRHIFKLRSALLYFLNGKI